ncbi:unnamed protein product [Closterium sp. Naga37s-1]|nr:unnamed protein product [Closterium sp. Naga37s-1]
MSNAPHVQCSPCPMRSNPCVLPTFVPRLFEENACRFESDPCQHCHPASIATPASAVSREAEEAEGHQQWEMEESGMDWGMARRPAAAGPCLAPSLTVAAADARARRATSRAGRVAGEMLRDGTTLAEGEERKGVQMGKETGESKRDTGVQRG